MSANAGLAHNANAAYRPMPGIPESRPVYNISASEASGLNYEHALLVSKGYDTNSQDDYPIQIGAFKARENAEELYNKVTRLYSIDSKIVFEDGFYKVRISRMPPDKKISDLNPGEKPVVVKTVLTDTAASRTIQSGAMSSINSDSISKDTINGSSKNDTLRKEGVLPNTMKAAGRLYEAFRGLFIIRGESPWLKRINYFGKSLIFVNALILAIIISIASMVVLLFIILMNRTKMEKEEQLHQFLMEKYQGLIIDYLFGTASHEDFKSIASDTYRRQVLIDQMIDVSINLKGEESKKLLNLYVLLSLDKDSIAKANDYRWHIKIKGFRELAFMNIKKANDIIFRALNSKNDILRMEAQIALVTLSEDNHFDFLSSLKTPFSLWEQITLHDLIIQHNIPLPSFQKWLTSSNPTVVMFCLRMIREFKQKEAEEKVKETLLHPSPEVRFLAVQVAGDMEMRSTLETMKGMYKNQDNKICLEIVKAMGKMPDLSMMNFLKLVLDKEDDVQLQIEATKAIENNGEEGVKALVKLMKSEYKNYNIIIRHVLDRRIF
jgi:HEAT repeat protein